MYACLCAYVHAGGCSYLPHSLHTRELGDLWTDSFLKKSNPRTKVFSEREFNLHSRTKRLPCASTRRCSIGCRCWQWREQWEGEVARWAVKAKGPILFFVPVRSFQFAVKTSLLSRQADILMFYIERQLSSQSLAVSGTLNIMSQTFNWIGEWCWFMYLTLCSRMSVLGIGVCVCRSGCVVIQTK